ncbi:MAG: GNAT family N-acetyltransferase [Bryobacteraceae bacterium]
MTTLEGSAACTIREPREPELPLCRMLLPEACVKTVGRYFRLAFAGRPEKVAAALSYRDDATALGGIRVHVIPGFRRTGIGSRLLAYAAEEARRFGRSRMFADVDLKSEAAAEPFLVSQSFRKMGTITFAEIGIEDLRASLETNRERLRSAVGRLPASVRFVGLAEAPMEEITRLYAEHIAQMRALAGMRDSFRVDRATESIAILIEEKLAGFVLARLDAGVLQIPAWVVAPESRGHQIGYALLSQLAERVYGRVERLRFEFTDAAVVTARMLSVPGCQVTKIAARFERALSL